MLGNMRYYTVLYGNIGEIFEKMLTFNTRIV